MKITKIIKWRNPAGKMLPGLVQIGAIRVMPVSDLIFYF